jgi:peptidoglycan/LPS O-acetylase OafA/YrhL
VTEPDAAVPAPQRETSASRGVSRFRHVPALDGFRGIAVLIVIGAHSTLVFRPSLLRTVVPSGFLGVDLFFVLSGFLITALLLTEQMRSPTRRISFSRFYLRRALRLLPALFALLAVHAVYVFLTGLPGGIEFRTDVAAVFYVSNWVLVTGHHVSSGMQHLWSLAIEEQFYLIWPLVVGTLLGIRRSLKFTVGALVVAILVVVVWRASLWKDGTNLFTLDYIYMRTDTRADTILVGALAANLWVRGALLPRHALNVLAWISAAFIAACVMFIPYWQGFYYKGGLTAVAVAAGIVLLAVVEAPGALARVLSWSPLRGIGQVSYGLYLWHLPVFVAVQRYGSDWPALAQWLVALAITAAATWLSWHFVETPFLRLKTRLRPTPQPT